MNPKPQVIFLMGPTASGKTDLAIALREHLPVELISVDSTMVYKGLDIGSAKPSARELAQAPHRLLGIRDPAEPYSAADFCADAEQAIAEIHAEGRIPLLVGGTMLYFKALLEGLAPMPSADPAVRNAIEREAERFGWPHVHAQLAAVDPQAAARIHPNHSQRLSRALEVYRVSGKTMTQLHGEQRQTKRPGFTERFRLTQLALAPRDRNLLHRRIEARFEKMLEQGLVEEVRGLRARSDLTPELPAMRAVGYRQVWEYLASQEPGQTPMSWQDLVHRGTVATRQLAKRQLTWLRGWPDLHWVYTQSRDGETLGLEEIVKNSLNYIGTKTI